MTHRLDGSMVCGDMMCLSRIVRADASSYAGRLFSLLTEKRISCFIDQNIYNAGDSLAVSTRRHVSKATVLVLLASPELLRVRHPTDWVEQEIVEYLEANQNNPKIIVLDFGNTISSTLQSDDHTFLLEHKIVKIIHQFIILPQELESLNNDPSTRRSAQLIGSLTGAVVIVTNSVFSNIFLQPYSFFLSSWGCWGSLPGDSSK